MASTTPTLMITPTTTSKTLNTKPKLPSSFTPTTLQTTAPPSSATVTRRNLITITALSAAILSPTTAAKAVSEDEYMKDTEEMINKVRNTLNMDRNDPNLAEAVAELRAASNEWVAKYRREKALLGRPSFRDMYSALNAVAGHYISFGPTTPIPNKRKARILEEMDSAEKALQRGR